MNRIFGSGHTFINCLLLYNLTKFGMCVRVCVSFFLSFFFLFKFKQVEWAVLFTCTLKYDFDGCCSKFMNFNHSELTLILDAHELMEICGYKIENSNRGLICQHSIYAKFNSIKNSLKCTITVENLYKRKPLQRNFWNSCKFNLMMKASSFGNYNCESHLQKNTLPEKHSNTSKITYS